MMAYFAMFLNIMLKELSEFINFHIQMIMKGILNTIDILFRLIPMKVAVGKRMELHFMLIKE
ncbi:MAG: hypothetical protein ACKO96_03890, partial [Flammeovirgaceae bacterium]